MSQKRIPKILKPESARRSTSECKDSFVFSSNLKHHCRHIVETKDEKHNG